MSDDQFRLAVERPSGPPDTVSLQFALCVFGEFLHSLAYAARVRELVFAHRRRQRVAEDEDDEPGFEEDGMMGHDDEYVF